MLDSITNKRRLLGFVASHDGRVTSGRTESLLRWVFEKFANERYTHERIHELELVFEALEADGDLVLERDERGKLFAAHLAADVDLGHADFESDMFESSDDLWKMIVTLLSANAMLRKELRDSDVETALEMAATAESQVQALTAQLKAANEHIARQAGSASAEEQLDAVQSELASVRSDLATANSRNEALSLVLQGKTEDWNREKRDLRNRLSAAGNDAARLREELAAASQAVATSSTVVVRLRAGLE